MQKMFVVSVATFAFGLGCVAATIYAPLSVPTAHAGGETQRWEQMCVPWLDKVKNEKVGDHNMEHVNEPKQGWNRVLKQYGEQGWELVSVQANNEYQKIYSVCFKRPLS